MPDLSDSTPPPVPPPAADSDSWEKLPAFRQTFLMYVTPPGFAAALQGLGEMLYSLILDTPTEWPGWTESVTSLLPPCYSFLHAPAAFSHVQLP